MDTNNRQQARTFDPALANHILPTSAILLGICFVIFAAVRSLGREEVTSLDEYALTGMFVFLASSVLSYLSFLPRARKVAFEQLANVVLLLGLIFLSVTSLIVTGETIVS